MWCTFLWSTTFLLAAQKLLEKFFAASCLASIFYFSCFQKLGIFLHPDTQLLSGIYDPIKLCILLYNYFLGSFLHWTTSIWHKSQKNKYASPYYIIMKREKKCCVGLGFFWNYPWLFMRGFLFQFSPYLLNRSMPCLCLIGSLPYYLFFAKWCQI